MTTKLALLHSIVAATASAQGFASIQGTTEARELNDAGLIEVNPNVLNLAEGHVAARATDAGKAHAEANPVQAEQPQANWGGSAAPTNFGEAAAQQTAQTTAPVEAGKAFIVVSGQGFAPQSAPKREGAKRDAPEKYPFGTLKAPTKREDGSIDYSGAVIFVPSTVDKTGKVRTADEMAFSLQSACSAANRRYGKELPVAAGERKKYEYDRTFKTQGGKEDGREGAYIYREFKD